FGQLQEMLGGPDGDHYQTFLYAQFAQPEIQYRHVLDALSSLPIRVAVTTNYGLLLEKWDVASGGDVVTWSQTERILSILRAGTGIVHLHGRFDEPESIILSESDYQRIVDQTHSNVVIDSLFHTGVLLFIGSSLEGVQDKHLSRILSRF